MNMRRQYTSLTLRRPEDIYGLTQVIAAAFPYPDDVFTGIYELLLNAIEHGNLGMDYHNKSEIIRSGRWEQEIERRLGLPEYRDRTVLIELVEDPYATRCTITDRGDGFDWKQQLLSNRDDFEPHGRGLWIAQNAAFDMLYFNDAGNAVTCHSLW